VPPLRGPARVAFQTAISTAYDDFCRRVDTGEETAIDPYASELIDEFFAVTCEVFFAEPELLLHEYPDYYGVLRSYFNVNPVAGRLSDL